ncbi:HNH endonuclease [Deinococcus marmoris]|uniref:HNH endonuclease family protein n=1 Tax=Deinococcus marmoris TaxID=249408 RepID=A0A1U7P2Y7_9DEIO|nr:HNH endonuclease [Deinococcus marmoris]OLV19520.1 HNH endonuclease family protein [Deinococcus marmoris]
MKIIFRHSRGRGEYEMSGDSDGYTTADVVDKHLTVVLSPNWRINTGLVIRRAEGKTRIRSEVKGEHIGVQRQVCAALLLNPTVRSQSGVDSGGQLLDYIEASHIEINGDQFVFHAETIQLSDATAEAHINVAKRAGEVQELWRRADELPFYVSEAIKQHQEGVTSGNPVSKATFKSYEQLPKFVASTDPEAEELMEGAGDLLPGLQTLTNAPVSRPLFDVELIPVQEVELKRRTIAAWRKWQLTSSRGHSGRVFREGVRAAYDSTCLICGVRLPPTPGNAAGVDAAHVLPWRQYELDEVYNGVCLCKTHHWAFDNRLLAIIADDASDDYRVEIPERARNALLARGETAMLSWLESFVGVIPEARLPRDPLLRPRREFLNILAANQELD